MLYMLSLLNLLIFSSFTFLVFSGEIISNINIVFPIFTAILVSVSTAFCNHIFTKKREVKSYQKQIKETRTRLAYAFWAEIAALFDLYEKVKMRPWDKLDDEIRFDMANIQYDYLSIFNSNADKIGIFDHDDAAEFVKFYMFTKYYIDSLRELSRRWAIQSTRCETYTVNPDNENLAMNCRSGLIDLFELYQLCYEQQTEFYHRRDEVKKTFDKYI